MTDAYEQDRLEAETLEACYRVVAVVNYAQRKATSDTAVGCVVQAKDGTERLVARRVGSMTNGVAIWAAVELALDATRDLGSAVIFSCLACTVGSMDRTERIAARVRDKAGDVKFRVHAKMGSSHVAFKYKRNDSRYVLAHQLAQKALEAGSEIWTGGDFNAGKAVDVATQSPAEQKLLDALAEFFPETCVHVADEFKYPARRGISGLLVPQFKVEVPRRDPYVFGGYYETKRYYLDFAVFKTVSRLCVEVDGAQYHTTPEAKIYDAQRDQDLRSAGWKVLHFTGSDVFRDARSCAEHVVAETPK